MSLTYAQGWQWAYSRLRDEIYTVAGVHGMLENDFAWAGTSFLTGAGDGVRAYIAECEEVGKEPNYVYDDSDD